MRTIAPGCARARDRAAIQDETARALVGAVLDASRVGKGTAYLDVACGSGIACAIAAGRGARVHGTEPSPRLLEIARGRVPAGDFRAGAPMAVPFPDGAFDVVTLMNPMAWMGDEVAALREAARVARPGATIAFVRWGAREETDATAFLGALAAAGGPAASPFAAPGALERLATRAGLRPARELGIDCPWIYADLDTLLAGWLSTPMAERVVAACGEDGVREAMARAAAPFRVPGGGYRLDNVFRCLIATTSSVR